MSDGPLHYINKLPERVVDTWVQEFGYAGWSRDAILQDRGGLTRWATELCIHGKRLADRAQMSRAPVGRAGVIR